jgi:transcriptional regulator with XRE-family HTH domain
VEKWIHSDSVSYISNYKDIFGRRFATHIAERLRQIRRAKKLSQNDIQKRTGLVRFYISRVENGYTVPSLETLQKFALALEIPLYQLFYEKKHDAKQSPVSRQKSRKVKDWTTSRKGQRILARLRRAASRMSRRDRQLLLAFAAEIANSQRSRKTPTCEPVVGDGVQQPISDSPVR